MKIDNRIRECKMTQLLIEPSKAPITRYKKQLYSKALKLHKRCSSSLEVLMVIRGRHGSS